MLAIMVGALGIVWAAGGLFATALDPSPPPLLNLGEAARLQRSEEARAQRFVSRVHHPIWLVAGSFLILAGCRLRKGRLGSARLVERSGWAALVTLAAYALHCSLTVAPVWAHDPNLSSRGALFLILLFGVVLAGAVTAICLLIYAARQFEKSAT